MKNKKQVSKVSRVVKPTKATKVSKPTRPTKPTKVSRVSKPLKRKATNKEIDIKETIKALQTFAHISMLKDMEQQKGLDFCYKALEQLADTIVAIKKKLAELDKRIAK